MYDQLSGRMAARVYRRVERRARRNGGGGHAGAGRGRTRAAGNRPGGDGAGPHEARDAPRGGRTARETAGGWRSGRGRQRRRPGPADRAAYRTLGLEPGASQERIRAAYRDLVKKAHPDAPEGSRERFKAITEAYERLTE